MLQSMGSQRVGHNLVIEQQQQKENRNSEFLLNVFQLLVFVHSLDFCSLLVV